VFGETTGWTQSGRVVSACGLSAIEVETASLATVQP
jgi:hypothetical protein